MNTSEFLFPSDLEITHTPIKKALFIGSCLAEVYVTRIQAANPRIKYDFILYNNASDLPVISRDEMGSYDFQYVQLPLRSVLTDAVIRIVEYEKTSNSDFVVGGR